MRSFGAVVRNIQDDRLDRENKTFCVRLIVENLRAFLAASPAALPAGQIGLQTPASGGDLPALVVSVFLDEGASGRLGRFGRESHGIVRHFGLSEVSSSNPAFSPGMDRLRVEPLPVRRNPTSLGREFGASDLLVRNVTVPERPVEYRSVPSPTGADEFAFRTSDAQIIFGQPQKSGDKLEVVHWTVAWREDITYDTYQGKLIIDVCAPSFAQVDTLHAAIESKLRKHRDLLRERGFYQLAPCALDPAVAVMQSTPFGSAFPMWKLRLSYRFNFEAEQGGEVSSGSPIRRIDVHLEGERTEAFALPSETAA